MQSHPLRASSFDASLYSSEGEDDDRGGASDVAGVPALRQQVDNEEASDEAQDADRDEETWQAQSDPALLESLCTRLRSVRFDQPEQWETCFQELAYCRNAASRAAHARPQTKWLAELARTLVRFLEDFDRHVHSGAIDLGTAGNDTSGLVCNGLGMLSELVDCRVYSAAAQKPLRAIVTRLSPLLVSGVMKGSVTMDREDTAATLTLLTWFSRGLKARLLQRDDAAIRSAFRDVLEHMVAWAEDPDAHGLDGQQLAACFVQLNTIRQFGLLPLEGDHRKAQQARELLQSVLKTLCGAVPELLTANGVTVANICNTLKDYHDAGLLPKQTHGWLMPVIALLLQRMPQVARAELVARSGQVLANFGNFLRLLSEPGLHEQPAFVGCAIGYRQACSHLITLLRHRRFRLDGDPGQSLANLMSFIKAMARLEVRESEKKKAGEDHRLGTAPLAEESAQRRSLLRAAAQRLLVLVEKHDEERLSPMSIGGLLSAIGYLWACRIVPADACRALMQRLFAAIPHCEHGRWDDATTALCLRAMVDTRRMAAADTSGLQMAFEHLLQLLQRSDVKDETHRLYCLQALRLGVQEKWVTQDTATWRQALRTLLRWKDGREPGLKELEAAVAGLAHREEAAPAVLETTADALPETQPLPLPGEVGWVPPGGKLAALSSAPALLPQGAAAKRSTTYRAPVDTSAGSFVPSHTTSTHTLSAASSVSTPTSQAPRARQVAHAEFHQPAADPVTRWFELASGDGSDDATLEALRALAKAKPALMHALDGAGNSALYYLVVSGKRQAMAWLIEQPGFSLGMSLDAFNARIDTAMFGSRNWNAARLAREDFDAAARRLFGAQEEEDEEPRDADQDAAAAKPASPPRGSRTAKAAARNKAKRRARAGAAFPTGVASSEQAAPGRRRAAAHAGMSDEDKLEQAFQDGDVARMIGLLRSEAGRAWARTKDEDGRNRLMLAVENGNVRIVEALLEVDNGALAEQFDDVGYSPLLYAAGEGKLEVLKPLMKFDKGRLALQQQQTNGMNVLALAVEYGHANCVKFLLAWNDHKQLGLKKPGDGSDTLLAIAARKGHVEVVQALLAYHVGKPAGEGLTVGHDAVMAASESGHADVLRVLLAWEKGKLNRARQGSIQALYAAALKGHGEALAAHLEFFDEDGRELFCQEIGGGPMLLVRAAESGHLAVVQRLLAFGVDPRVCREKGLNALKLAAKHGHADIVQALVQKGGVDMARQEVNPGQTAFVVAGINRRQEVIDCLIRFDSSLAAQIMSNGLSAKAAVEREQALSLSPSPAAPRMPSPGTQSAASGAKEGEAALLNRAFVNDDPDVGWLLSTEAGKAWAREWNKEGYNRLMIAVFHGKARMVELLLEVDDGALATQFSVYGSSALLISAETGRLDILKTLLEFGNGRLALHKNTKDGSNALMLAAACGHLECVEVLLAWKDGRLAERHESSKTGWNALFFAAHGGHGPVVKLLLGYKDGDLATMTDKDSNTAMAIAATYGKEEVVRELLGWRHGGLAVVANAGGYTPLLLAAQRGDCATLGVLLNSPHGDTLKDFCLVDRRNALMLAAEAGHADAVRTLLNACIDPCECNDAGENALMLAAKNSHVKVVDVLLQKNGASQMRQVSKSSQTALTLAMENGMTRVSLRLLEFNATLPTSVRRDDPITLSTQAHSPGSQPGEAAVTASARRDGNRTSESSSTQSEQIEHSMKFFHIKDEFATAVLKNDVNRVREIVVAPSFREISHFREIYDASTLVAIRGRQLEMMRVLINIVDWRFLTEVFWEQAPWHIAVENRDPEMLGLILDHIPAEELPAALQRNPEHGIELALQNGDSPCLALLLERSQRVMRLQDYASFLEGLRCPPRDAAHSVALAMLDAEQTSVNEQLHKLLAVDGAALMRQKSHAGETALSLAKANGHDQVHERSRRHARDLSQHTVKAEGVAQRPSSTPKQQSGPATAAISTARKNPHGDDALLLAIQASDLTTVRSLLSQPAFGKMLEYRSEDGKDPVRVAVQSRRTDIVEALIDSMPWSYLIEDDTGPSTIRIAVENRDAAMLRLILGHIPIEGVDFHLLKAVRSGIQAALSNGDSACLVLLLDCAQVFMRPLAYAQLLAGLQRPPADDAHRAALAMVDVKQAVVGARRASVLMDGALASINRDRKKDFDFVARMLPAPNERGGS